MYCKLQRHRCIVISAKIVSFVNKSRSTRKADSYHCSIIQNFKSIHLFCIGKIDSHESLDCLSWMLLKRALTEYRMERKYIPYLVCLTFKCRLLETVLDLSKQHEHGDSSSIVKSEHTVFPFISECELCCGKAKVAYAKPEQ